MSRLMSAAVTLVVLCVAAACGETTAPQPAISAQGQVAHLSGSSGGGGGGGGGGGAVTPPSNCVADVSAFNNTPGYGPYSPIVADITTKFTVRNCTAAAVSWQARVTYRGPFWGGSVFSFPLTCALPIAARSSGTCQVRERYLFIQQIYQVTLDVLNGSGGVIATSTASVATPAVPNPAPGI